MARTPLRLRRYAQHNRKNPTPGERRLWYALRRGATGAKFRRQHPIGPYICDFVSLSAGIVIEVDGDRHGSEARRLLDAERDTRLRAMGFRVLRVTEDRARDHATAIADEVWAMISGLPLPPPPGDLESWG